MRPALVLNHSCIVGMLQRDPATWRRPLVELWTTLSRVRRIRGKGTFHVHPHIGSAEVEPGRSFVSWANQHLHSKDWRNILEPLLQLISGPYYTELSVDTLPCPSETQPSCLHVPSWLQEMVLHCTHHVLGGGGAAWLLSYGDNLHLTAESYLAERGGQVAQIRNLRSEGEARVAEVELGQGSTRTVLEVLEEAAKHAERVRVLPSALDSARRYGAPFSIEMLFRSITGLDAYAKALDRGESREQAAASYQHSCGIEMSQEKAATLKPTLKKVRMFRLLDRSEHLFDMHAKPGDLRVHIFSRSEAQDPNNPGADNHTVVYIGHCGEHLPLK